MRPKVSIYTDVRLFAQHVAPNSPRDIALPSSLQQEKCIEQDHETRCDSVIFMYVRTEYAIKTAPEAPQAISMGENRTYADGNTPKDNR
jgi:hypothetical protein